MLLESCQVGARVAPLSLKAIGTARIAAEDFIGKARMMYVPS